MIKRWMTEDVMSALRSRRGVHLTGARQSGKTTLSTMLEVGSCKRRPLDDDGLLAMAKASPSDFVERHDGETLIIDEIQKAPELLNAIKMRVDADSSRSQYLLTGSSNLRFTKAVKDSLAGRFATIRLRTLTSAEINGAPPHFLDDAFNHIFPTADFDFGKKDALRNAFAGGYPEQLGLSVKERRRWYRDYLNDLLTKDIKDVTEIRKIDVLMNMAEWLLAHSSQFFTIEELCTKIGMSKPTVENYLEALKALYIFDKIPAWTKSEYDRIGRRPKWIASDTGLIANIQRWDESEMLLDARSGKLLESWVYHELVAQVDLRGYEIKHYRDRLGHEIDFVVENLHGDALGIEVKAGSSVGHDDFKNLRWFARNLADKKFIGIVMYTGRYTLKMSEGFYAVPMGALCV